jgi:hypothetical protein
MKVKNTHTKELKIKLGIPKTKGVQDFYNLFVLWVCASLLLPYTDFLAQYLLYLITDKNNG